MKKENKISLLKDIKNPFVKQGNDKNNVADERVLLEMNNVLAKGYILVFCVFALIGIVFKNIDTRYISLIIGVISYGMILMFCKKTCVVGNDIMLALLIDSFIILPLDVTDIILEFVGTKWLASQLGVFSIVLYAVTIVVIPLSMYQIANYIYNKSSAEKN